MQDKNTIISFRTLSEESRSLLREKNSKFIGIACRVDSETSALRKLAEIKSEFKDANHHCYAFCIGHNKTIKKCSDDHEPSGTAGLPILNQCLSFDITNVIVIVVRYFGGTKLGVPGLIQAYKESAKEALSKAKIIVEEPNMSLFLKFDYKNLNTIMTLLKLHKAVILDKKIDTVCELKLQISLNRINMFWQELEQYRLNYFSEEISPS